MECCGSIIVERKMAKRLCKSAGAAARLIEKGGVIE